MRTLFFVTVEVGLRELRARLSEYVDRAVAGEDVLVTRHGRVIARLTTPDGRDALADLIARGVATPPTRPKRAVTASELPRPRGGTVSDIVIAQRRERR
jgi:prevent-host-death family protein